jgi:hypothetical protein
MNKMSNHELTARINRFMDRKLSNSAELSDLSVIKSRRGYRQQLEVSAMPYIALAVK